MTLGVFRHELVMKIAKDTTGKQVEFDRPSPTVLVDKGSFWNRVHGGNFAIAASAVESLDLGDVTSPSSGLYLEVDGDCDVLLNGLSGPLQVRRAAKEASQLSKVFIEAQITSISITNASATSELTGTYRVWGDENP